MSTINGTSGNDVLTGTSADDTINGLEGNDQITGNGGNDTLLGGAGDDSISAGAGNSYIDGGPGDDTLIAGLGASTLLGGDGNDLIQTYSTNADTIDGGPGYNVLDFVAVEGTGPTTFDFNAGSYGATSWQNMDALMYAGSSLTDHVMGSDNPDTMFLGAGDDYADGRGGNDYIYGDEGNDVIHGGAGDDTIVAGTGNDTVQGGPGDDVMYGGSRELFIALPSSEFDTLDYSDTTLGVTVDLAHATTSGAEIGNDSVIDFEGVIGGSGKDTIIWSADTWESRSSEFAVDGGAGTDQFQAIDLYGAALTGSPDGTSILTSGVQVPQGVEEHSVSISNVESYSLVGGPFDQTAVQVAGSFAPGTTITMGTAASSTTWFNATDLSSATPLTVLGGADSDTFSPAANGANDYFDGGAGYDWLDYYNSLAGVTVNLATGTATGADMGTDTFINVEAVSGSPAADTLVGNSGDNELDGWEGNDTLTGGGGNDILNGGDGVDTVIASGNFADYAVTTNDDGSYTLSDNRGTDGTDTLIGVEMVQFADGTYDVASAVFTPNAIQGVVADGYVSGATVFIDSNHNGLWDADEAKAFTDATGHFAIVGASTGQLVASGGTNIDSGLPNTIVLTAPAGATVINPLTTLVQALVSQGLSLTDAETRVTTTLGLTSTLDLLNFDPLATPADARSLLAQKAAASIVEIADAAQQLAPGSGSTAIEAIANALASSTTAVSLADPSLVTDVLQAAAPGVSVAAAVNSVVIANTSIENATSVAAVSSIQGDVTPPDAPTNMADTSIVSGYVNALNNTAAQALTGSAEAGSTVTLYDGSTKLGTTTADQNGVWTYNIGLLVEGQHSFTATATDAAGNVSQSSTALGFTVDTHAPNAPGVVLVSDSGTSNTDKVTNTAALSVTRSEAGGTLSYQIDSGAWAASYNPAALNDGLHSVRVTQSDAAGNVSAAGLITFTLDTRAPIAPTISLTSDTGSSSTDRITSNASLSFTPAETGGAMSYKLDTGAWSSSFSTVGLSDGHHTLQATQTDAAGNISNAGSFTFTLDTTAPKPALSGYAATSSSSTFSGTSEAGSTIKVYDGATLVGSAVANSTGAWTLTTSALTSSAHSLSLKAVDVAGNAGTSAGDILIGTGANDTLSGHATDDFLWGGAGNDTLNGGSGNDRLVGGAGNDVMTGGAGADTFVFGAGFGNDAITDFTPGTDHLELSKALFPSTWSEAQIFTYIMNNSSSQGSGHNLALKIDASDVITLNNVAASSLHQSDFIFT